MGKEEFQQKFIDKSEFERQINDMESLGWVMVSHESLTRVKFSKDASFIPEPFQTEEDIKIKYLNKAKSENPTSEYEIELVIDQNSDKLRSIKKVVSENEYQEILQNLRDEDKTLIVLMRKK